MRLERIEKNLIESEVKQKKMSEWNGNDIIFRTYMQGGGVDGKSSIGKHKGINRDDFETASKYDCFGAELNSEIIDISFDSKDMYEKFLDMAEANKWRCLALSSSKGGHSYWKDTYGIIKKGGKDKKLAVGLVADIHHGATYIPLRVFGVDRFPPDYDIFEGEDYQEVPEELYPVNSKAEPFGMSEGGRNETLSSMTKNLVYNTRFTKGQIKRIITNTNIFILGEPVPDEELEVILRNDTFRDMPERKLNTINAAELFYMDIKPTEFIINGLIPIGQSLVASPPKYGKSWLMLDMAIAVASGKDFLGFTTNQCGVLYLALEDRQDRLKERMLKITNGMPFPEGLEIAIDAPPLGEGFMEYVEDFLNEHPETKLIIIDTFVKIRGVPSGKESAYATDSREAGDLKKFADRHGIAVVLVTHTRKAIDPNDPLANITGTYGIAGAADDMIVLTKEKRSDTLTKMSVTGRDVVYEEYPIVFDKNSCKWMRQGDSYELAAVQQEHEMKWAAYQVGNIRKTIMKLLEENSGTWQGRCNEILTKSKEYGTPILMTSQSLGKELLAIAEFLYRDKIVHTEIGKGTASKIQKFEKV